MYLFWVCCEDRDFRCLSASSGRHLVQERLDSFNWANFHWQAFVIPGNFDVFSSRFWTWSSRFRIITTAILFWFNTHHPRDPSDLLNGSKFISSYVCPLVCVHARPCKQFDSYQSMLQFTPVLKPLLIWSFNCRPITVWTPKRMGNWLIMH